ncbi:MAG: GldL-related protein [Oceanihabitans sp.]
MKKIEKILASIILFGFLFKLMHWPFSNEILALGAVFLSMLYFGFSFALLNNIKFKNIFKQVAYNGISKLRLFVAIATGVIFSALVIYCLFKVMFWPYGQIGLEIVLKVFILLIAIILFEYFIKNRKLFLNLNYKRFIIIGLTSVFIYFITNDQLVDLYYGSDPVYAEEYKAYLNETTPNTKRPSKEFKSN